MNPSRISDIVRDEVIIDKSYVTLVKTNKKDNKILKRDRVITTGEFHDRRDPRVILPEGCRYYKYTNNGDLIFIIEDQPQVRTITLENDLNPVINKLEKEGKLEDYGFADIDRTICEYSIQLSFPYIVYFVGLSKELGVSSVYCFFRLSPLTGFMDYLLKPNLLNVNGSMQYCSGIKYPDGARTPSNVIESLKESMWVNTFNADYIENYNNYLNSDDGSKINDYLTWSYFTQVDPMFIFGEKWQVANRNVGEVIAEVESSYGDGRYYFDRLTSILCKKNMMEVDQDNIENKYSIMEEYIYNGHLLNIGDDVVINDKVYYILNFYISSDEVVLGFECEDQDGNKLKVRFSDSRLCKSLLDYLNNRDRIETVIINDIEIKQNDIVEISLPSGKILQRVSRIRKCIDGKIEVKVGRSYYLLENFRFQKITLEDHLFKGKCRLIEGKSYVVKYPSGALLVSSECYIARFDGYRVSAASKLVARFRYGKQNYGKTVKENDNSEVIDYVEVNRDYEKTTIYSVFDNVYTSFGHEVYCSKNDVIYTNDRSRLLFDVDEFINNCTINGGTIFRIPAVGRNIEFELGETVVYAGDTDDAELMRSIFIIDEFVIDKERGGVFFKLKNIRTKEIKEIQYVKFHIQSSGIGSNPAANVAIGTVRKISPSYGGLRSGDKVRLKIPGVPHFPKKDVNQIIGFITDTDTKYPLIYFSNLCTLWATPEMMNDFTVYKRGTTKYKTIKIADSPKRIKVQAGDLYQSIDNGNMVFIFHGHAVYGGNVLYSGNPYYGIYYGTKFTPKNQRYYKRVGILTPRHNMTKYHQLDRRSRLPNCHGGYIEQSPLRISTDDIGTYREDWDNV